MFENARSDDPILFKTLRRLMYDLLWVACLSGLERFLFALAAFNLSRFASLYLAFIDLRFPGFSSLRAYALVLWHDTH